MSPETHIAVVRSSTDKPMSANGWDTLEHQAPQFVTLDGLPQPVPMELAVEIRAMRIMRQPGQWVILVRCPGGVRVALGRIQPFNIPKPEGLN